MNQRAAPTRPSRSHSDIVAMLECAQKSSRGAPGYTRWINRRLGRHVAAIAAVRGWTPNQVTMVSAVFTFSGISAVALIRPTWWLGIVVALALACGYVLDSADGQVARLRGGGTPAGEWLDHMIDCIKCATIHSAVLVCWFRFYDLSNDAYLLIPLAFALKQNVFYFAIMLSEQLRRAAQDSPRSTVSRRKERAPVWYALAVLPADYGTLCWSFVLLGARTPFMWVYGGLMVINNAFLLGALPRWYREMRTFGAAGLDAGGER